MKWQNRETERHRADEREKEKEEGRERERERMGRKIEKIMRIHVT